jgi:hypothetical protein
MFITHENFRAPFANLMDDDLASWRMVSHNAPFTWLYVYNEVLVPSENGPVPVAKFLLMYNPLHIDVLIEKQGDGGRVLSVTLMKAPSEGELHYQSCVVKRILSFKSDKGMPRHVYEVDVPGVIYSHGPPGPTDELEVLFDAGSIREF